MCISSQTLAATTPLQHPQANASFQQSIQGLSSPNESDLIIFQPSPMYPSNLLLTNIINWSEPTKVALDCIEPPISKKNARNYVLPTPGSKIICKWNGCGALVDPTREALKIHTKQHVSMADNTDRGWLKCEWIHGPDESLYNHSVHKSYISRHFGTHLHNEGQPSPFLERMECWKKIYVYTGRLDELYRPRICANDSCSTKLTICMTQNIAPPIQERNWREKLRSFQCCIKDPSNCPHPYFCLLSMLKGDLK